MLPEFVLQTFTNIVSSCSIPKQALLWLLCEAGLYNGLDNHEEEAKSEQARMGQVGRDWGAKYFHDSLFYICQVSWVSWGSKITLLFFGSVFSSLALEFETLWHCALQMLKLALVEIFSLFDLLFSFAALSPPAVSEDWRIAWVFPLFLGRHSGTVASSNILLSNKQLVLERDFDLNPL